MELSKEAAGFVSNHYIGTIATVNIERQPRASTVGYVYHNKKIYILTKKATKKFANVNITPKVGFTITDQDTLSTLQTHCTVTIVNDLNTVLERGQEILVAFQNSHVDEWFPGFKTEGLNYALLELRIEDYDFSGYKSDRVPTAS